MRCDCRGDSEHNVVAGPDRSRVRALKQLPCNKTYPRRALRHLCLSLVEGDSVAPECSVKRLPCAPVVLYHPGADDLRYSKGDVSMV